MSGTQVDLDALSRAAEQLRRGSQALERTGSSVPAGVDAGVATALVDQLLQKVTESAGNLSTALGVSADNLDATRASYSATDDGAAHRVGIY